MERPYLMEVGIIVLHLVHFEKFAQNVFPFALTFASSTSQCSRDATARLTRGNKVHPLGLNGLRLRGENLDLVTIRQAMTHGHKAVIDFSPNAMATHHGVDGKGKVENRGTLWEGQNVAFWGEDIEFGSKEVEFDGIEEVERVGLGIIEDFLD